MPKPAHERMVLDARDDVLRIVLPNGMMLEFEISPEQMVALNVWAFARKTVHIIEGVRRVEPFTPIAQSRVIPHLVATSMPRLGAMPTAVPCA